MAGLLHAGPPQGAEDPPEQDGEGGGEERAVAAQVVDAFPLNDEIDVFQARIRLLEGVATRVLVAEGSHTHQGTPKRPALDQVPMPGRVERILCDLSGHGRGDEANWVREGVQREFLNLRLEALLGSGELSGDTLVVSSDVDELVDPRALPRILEATEGGPVILHMRMIYYGRWENPSGWYHAKAFRLADAPESLTGLRLRFDLPHVPESGWHVSYRGGEEALRHKMECFAHGENLNPLRWERIRTGRETGLGPNGETLRALGDTWDLPDEVRELL